MNACQMVHNCLMHQLDNLPANMDAAVWALLLAEGFISRETVDLYPQGVPEDALPYPGYYPLDDIEAGHAIFV